MSTQHIFLIRHGETEWTLNRRHTGTTDIPLTENGRRVATSLRTVLAGKNFDLVLTSPFSRARETCELAGLGNRCEIDRDLVEWNYGEYEGLTPEEINARNPRWLIFQDGCPGGENPDQVATRVDRVISRVRAGGEYVAIFAHGHLLRSLAPRWLSLPVGAGCHFLLDPATLSILSHYRDVAAIKRWNAPVTM